MSSLDSFSVFNSFYSAKTNLATRQIFELNSDLSHLHLIQTLF